MEGKKWKLFRQLLFFWLISRVWFTASVAENSQTNNIFNELLLQLKKVWKRRLIYGHPRNGIMWVASVETLPFKLEITFSIYDIPFTNSDFNDSMQNTLQVSNCKIFMTLVCSANVKLFFDKQTRKPFAPASSLSLFRKKSTRIMTPPNMWVELIY